MADTKDSEDCPDFVFELVGLKHLLKLYARSGNNSSVKF